MDIRVVPAVTAEPGLEMAKKIMAWNMSRYIWKHDGGPSGPPFVCGVYSLRAGAELVRRGRYLVIVSDSGTGA